MAKRKIKRTRLELKRQRDALRRFERYLPLLKLKQQQLQVGLNKLQARRRKARAAVEQAREAFDRYRDVLADTAGVDVEALARPEEVKTSTANVAGVNVPVFEGVTFPAVTYSLFATPAWVDRTLADLRELTRRRTEMGVLDRQDALIRHELTRVIQRVNLFEKIKIPACRENIRVIRIALGDEMTAAVVRAKIAKAKLAEVEHGPPGAAAEEAA